MTTARFVESSVTFNNNSPIQDYIHPDDQTQPTYEMTPGFIPFTVLFTVSFKLKNFERLFLCLTQVGGSSHLMNFDKFCDTAL